MPYGESKVNFGGQVGMEEEEETEDDLMWGWMSDLCLFQTPPWCGGGVMSTRRKHRALNGITQGDVNLGGAGVY